MAPLIQTRGLRYGYADGQEALSGVDFRLLAGQSVILLGANGAGKTTFLLHLNGLLRGDGEVDVCGVRLGGDTVASIRRKVGLVFQDADDQLFLPTVIEDIAFGLLNQGIAPAEALDRARGMLARLHIETLANRSPHHLSEGEKRRVALAGVLVMHPEILLLDEPTSALDPPSRRDLIEMLAGLPQAKVIATHDTAFAQAVGTAAVFFEAGRITDEGPVAEVIARHSWH
jgi:cobalt/nickel transport system ATP-binding protein